MPNFNASRYRDVSMYDTRSITISFVNRVYAWMFTGLLLTALSASAVIVVPELRHFIVGTPQIILPLFLLQIGLVMALSWGINRMNSIFASIAFIVYSLLNGLTLSLLFFVYSTGSLALAFLVCAGMFGVMSVYGFVTKKDLTTIGNLCWMGLIGIIIASLVNLFMQSSALEWIISYVGVAVFLGLIAYDTQKIKDISDSMDATGGETAKKYAIIGALALYLDFINLFIMLLRILGNRR